MKNLSLHNIKWHKAYLVQQDEEISLVESALDLEMHEYSIENKDEIILFDLDNKVIIEKFEKIESVRLDNHLPISLSFKGFDPNVNSKFTIPKSVENLYIDGGDYMSKMMSKSDESLKIWNDFVYNTQTWKFITTLEERFKIEADQRSCIKNIKSLNLNSPIQHLLAEIAELNISELSLRWIYISETEFDLIHKFKNVQSLDLAYIYNDELSRVKFPPNLTFLRIYGLTIESLTDINVEDLKLESLDLEGNTIIDLSTISKLPNTLEDLNLKMNHIKEFTIADLPENLEYLFLDDNLIGNTLFEGINKDVTNTTIKYLSLSNNVLKVNNWLLQRITETFPMLEYIELSGNEICDIPEELLLNDEENSSIDKINYWMELQDYQHPKLYSELKDSFNYYDKTNSIILKWKHKLLPSKIILSDIQAQFNNYLGEMKTFDLFREGLYCDIDHDKISLVIREETEPENSIILELYAANREAFNTYYYKYCSEINRLVKLNTHHHILPVASFAEKCEIYEKFFKFVFHIEKQIKNNFILQPNQGEDLLLVNNKNDRNDLYKELKDVAFIIVTGKSAYSYVIDDKFVISNVDFKCAKFKYFYNLTLRTSEEKQDYVNSITNKYLGYNSFEEAIVFAGGDITQKITVYFNPNYFYEKSNNIFCKNKKIEINEQLLVAPESGSNLLNVTFKEGSLFLKYRVNPEKVKKEKKADKPKSIS
ncbi:hypothetical protein [Flavobacterium praedii]|uniref:hypothetical protein n=1 Tax=Flavobacterium praedii TaxID=3002900 RepID=UPI0024819F5F|nr:hypothetical protein [Flavobacterium praedii]